MRVVATAGHVDHGKSTLLRALTGMEPDRWEEERRRGLTLDLGFVWTALPDGEPLAFVDVPGHERLVGTMLAGVGPVPAVLLVVAADQGWQAQSEEHLAICDALRVRHGLLAVTRCDLAAPATVRAVRDDARARIAATSLGAVPAVTVSAVTGEGLAELRTALARLAAALPPPDVAADVRLWVDRAFTVRGHGCVVTGTLAAGTLRTGDRLHLDDGTPVRVRALQALRRDYETLSAVARVAVNLHGATPGDGAGQVRRGRALLTPGRWLTTGTVDVRLHGDPPAALPRHLTLHLGTAAVPVTVRPLHRDHDTARLTLARPLPLRVGDTALLRDPGRHRVPARVTVLDVEPPPLTRRGAAAARARALATVTGVPDGAAELRRRGLARRDRLRAMGVVPPPAPRVGDWLVDPDHWAELRRRLARLVAAHAAAHPLDPGLPTEAARRELGLPERRLVEALADVTAPGLAPLTHRQGRLYGAVTAPELPPSVRRAVATVRRELAGAPFRAPHAGRLRELGLTREVLAAAAAAGALLRLADEVVLLPGDDARAAEVLAKLDQPFTLSEARRALDTTRRVAVPLLEHLDRRGWTVRLDELHRRVR